MSTDEKRLRTAEAKPTESQEKTMTKPVEKHFVTFMSPGTFVSEATTKPIEAWATRKAVEIGDGIVERHGAKPYGFRFETRLCTDPVPDGRGGTLKVEQKTIATSGMHFLGGRLETLDDVDRRADPKENVLRMNMSGNETWIVCIIDRGYRSTIPFEEKDVIVNASGDIVERGDDAKYVGYRAGKDVQRAAGHV